MQAWLRKHYQTLELESSASFEQARQAFKTLSFIWHPDRQPEKYKEIAAEKIQSINEAYQFFEGNREYLNQQQKWEPDFGISIEEKNYNCVEKECIRCNGSGFVANDVSNSSEFTHVNCPVCSGEGMIIVDERNCCADCHGNGMNPDVSTEDRNEYIDNHLNELNFTQKFAKKLHYKKLWLKFHQEELVCKSCKGSGYFYLKQNQRHEDERRLFSEADFLYAMENSDKRQGERRHPVTN